MVLGNGNCNSSFFCAILYQRISCAFLPSQPTQHPHEPFAATPQDLSLYHDVTQSMCLHMSWTCYDASVCMSAKQVKPCISIHEKVYEAKWHYIGEEGK